MTRLGDCPRASGTSSKFGSAGIDGRLARVARPIPVARPLPYVADHVVEAIAVRREAADRRGPGIAVLVGVVDGEDALPGVGDRLALGIESARLQSSRRRGRRARQTPIAPRSAARARASAHRRAHPRRRCARRDDCPCPQSSCPGPAGARQFAPAMYWNHWRSGRRLRHWSAEQTPRTRERAVPRHAGMRRRIEPALRQRDISRGRHEFPKLRVGHLVAIDPEAVDAHDMGKALLRPMALGAHDESSAADRTPFRRCRCLPTAGRNRRRNFPVHRSPDRFARRRKCRSLDLSRRRRRNTSADDAAAWGVLLASNTCAWLR